MSTARVSADNIVLRDDADPNSPTIKPVAKDAEVTLITDKTVNGTTWLLVSVQIAGLTHVGWLPQSAVAMAQPAAGVIDWSKTPQVDVLGFHSGGFGGQSWRVDTNGVYLQAEPNTPRRTNGDPITCTKILSIYGDAIFKASMKYGIAPELIVMTIATETADATKFGFTGPETFRWEAHLQTYSAGPMQTLATTAAEVIRTLHLPYDASTVARAFPVEPKPPPALQALPLYDRATNVDIGTGEIKLNSQRHPTGSDPILVAACYNAGHLGPSSANPWGLLTYGDHLNRASQWFGDACAVLATLRAGGALDPRMVISDPQVVPASDKNAFRIDNLLSKEADDEVTFYRDAGATATKVPGANGFFSVSVQFQDIDQAPPQGAQQPVPGAQPPPGQFPPPDDTRGFVLCLDRVQVQDRHGASYDRTVSFYQAYFNGQRLPIFGMAAERQLPGDNGLSGKQLHSCISAGTYPLSTHAGANGKYSTTRYSSDASLGARPYPAILVENTGQRDGILIHCAKGYLWSIGCINLASQLDNASADINFADSRSRVIALIDSMRTALGSDFPRSDNQEIPGARLVIRDHVQA